MSTFAIKKPTAPKTNFLFGFGVVGFYYARYQPDGIEGCDLFWLWHRSEVISFGT